MAEITEKKLKKVTKKTKTTKKSLENENHDDTTIDNKSISINKNVDKVKNDEKLILDTNETIKYNDIDKHKKHIKETVDKIIKTENIIDAQENKICDNTYETPKTIISESEFSEKIKFIEEHQDFEMTEVETLVETYVKLSKYVKECQLYMESTNLSTHIF
jgi:hypothetical protein